ncbi:MAG: hypothetical protein ABI472_08450 [Ginsengibacter sp.]
MQPTMSSDEQVACEQAVLASPEFAAALEQYGVSDMSLVMVDIWSAGYYGAGPGNPYENAFYAKSTLNDIFQRQQLLSLKIGC